MKMFCYQCQETAKNTGCTIAGVCGKKDDLANMMDLLMYVTKGVSIYAVKAREAGLETPKANKFVFEALFNTITNANFDKAAIIAKIKEGFDVRKELKGKLDAADV